MRMKSIVVTLLVCALSSASAVAQDARQFRGPERDGKYASTGLLKAWPEGGPKQLWTASGLGMGYSTATVVGDTIYVTGMVEDNEGVLFALGLDGTLQWKLPYGKESKDKQAPGTRATVTVEGEFGYTISGVGVVNCFNLKERSVVWQVDMMARFEGKKTLWEISESPLIVGDMVICTPGGPDATMAALNKKTGDTVWTTKGLSESSGYCSPNLINHNGRDIIISMAFDSVIGVDPKDGTVLWTHEHKTRYGIHASTPAYVDGLIFYSACSKSGSGALQLSEDGASITPLWKVEDPDIYHGGFIVKDGYVYGCSQSSSKDMICLEVATGKEMWRTSEVSDGALVYADGMLYLYEGPKVGVVNLIKATPEGFERTGQLPIIEGTDKHWAHPTIAGKTLYIRRGEFLFAYDIGA